MDMPRYVKIAMDIAQRIYVGELQVGEKVRGRSTLASQYSVSPETIRRSISLLSEMGVVKVYEKSGIFIESPQRAYLFIQQHKAKQNLHEIRQKINHLQHQKFEIEKELNNYLDILLEYSMGLELHSSMDLHRVTIQHGSPIIGQSVAATQFWKHTNATILSVIRGDEEHISPGPNFMFEQEDVLTIICAEENLPKVNKYLQPTKSK
ncbi:TrkA C-terminal domain-containing protein [Rubeoparvulum massiliense]|uniref:TrkA C-terminal domain-containing protein n=1 Tax=Rubeoparvulum massiliense TaxID=1631346 RepID=UPI00065DCCE1|nr:TrkA C-terminal domain-containing protein [Rubeoparvulum massiliense]